MNEPCLAGWNESQLRAAVDLDQGGLAAQQVQHLPGHPRGDGAPRWDYPLQADTGQLWWFFFAGEIGQGNPRRRKKIIRW